MRADEQYVMKLIGGVDGMERHPELMAHVGRYVEDYKPELARKGQQWLWTTDDISKAMGFPEFSKAHEMYRWHIGTRYWDGKPDRPLTAYHIQVAKRKEFYGNGIDLQIVKMLEQG